jgi:hypothetical protein
MKTISLLGLASLVVLGCSSSGAHGGGAPTSSKEITLHAEAPVLPDFKYDTGLQPASGPAQAQLTLSSAGSIVVDAAAAGANGKLQGKPGGGTLKLDMHVKLAGHLKVDAGLVKYDGDLPGIQNVDIPILGTTPFDGLVLDGAPAQVVANVPETKLPDIPLGSVPGHLALTVATGTTVTVAYHASCLDVHGGQAKLQGQSTVSGKLVLTASIVLDIPLHAVSVDLPTISVDLPQANKELDTAPVAAAGIADGTQGNCASAPGASAANPTGGGGGNGGGGGGGGSGGGGTGDGGVGNGGDGAVAPGNGTGDAGVDASADNACGALGAMSDCMNCCFTAHPAGAATYTALVNECVCVTPGECQTQCGANYCTDSTTMSPECDICLNASSCLGTARSTCASAGGDCAALVACVEGQACPSKP